MLDLLVQGLGEPVGLFVRAAVRPELVEGLAPGQLRDLELLLFLGGG